MKQCRTDCIHAEACRRYADNSTYWQNGDCPIYKPIADVVPKSEVKELRKANIELELKNQLLYDEGKVWFEKCKTTKAEIAREIFEDIRNTCGYSVAEHDGVVLYHTKCYSIMATKLDELEKKYTESEAIYDKTLL